MILLMFKNDDKFQYVDIMSILASSYMETSQYDEAEDLKETCAWGDSSRYYHHHD